MPIWFFCLKMLNNNIHINMDVDQCGHRKLQTRAYATSITNKSPWYSWKIAELASNNNHSRGGSRISSGGGALKKIVPSGERREHFWGYFVWKITILRQKIIFFPIAEWGVRIFGVFRVKNHDFTPKNHIFSTFRVGALPWICTCTHNK